MVAVYPNGQSATFFILETINTAHRKSEVVKMIEDKNEVSKELEKALQALEQAKQRVANEKKKQNEKRRTAENHHKYIMGGIIVKYFPECYHIGAIANALERKRRARHSKVLPR